MDKREKQLLQLSLTNCSRKHYNDWIFRDVPSDISIEVVGAIFALHKFPLVSKSGRIRKLIADHRDTDISTIELHGFPGGADTFELATKFCYSINFEITPANVAELYCISDYLQMTEAYSKDNLQSRAEQYLNTVVCKNIEMCVEVLQHTETLAPLADDLKIVTRCIDSIASKACVEQIASSFSRLEYSSSGRLQMNKQSKTNDWWINDLSILPIETYQRVIIALKFRGVRAESIGASLMNYAQERMKRTPESINRTVVETIVDLLPAEKMSVPISFLFGLLRSSILLDCAISCRSDLERRIGSQLDIVTIDDLLIPSFRHAGDTLFDVDTVHRILLNFSPDVETEEDEHSGFESDPAKSPSQTALLRVSKLIDNYLAEIAPDVNLKITKFFAIAENLPAHARTIHDGLYRAIDIYLKAHPDLPDLDKKRLCKLIDFQRLSQEAANHAAQNERLPLQAIVQVLYFEQMRLRSALFCSCNEDDRKTTMRHQSWRMNSSAYSYAMSPKDNYASLRRENRELKLELARLRMRLNDLEKEQVSMKKNMAKSNSRKFISSVSRKMGRFSSLFGSSTSRTSSSPP